MDTQNKEAMLFAEVIVYFVLAYLAIGALVAPWFAVSGITRLDESAKGTSFGFRFLIFWGALAFWPLLLKRVLSGAKRPIEANAHREAAR